jgi:hypothetical protein
LFSLITTIISIGLVSLLAYVSLSYLQPTLGRAPIVSSAALIISQASQIASANRVHAATHGGPTVDMQGLVNAKLLQSIPVPPFKDGGQYTFTAARVVRLSITDEKLCAEIQKRLTSNPAIPLSLTTQGAGCYNSDGAYVFFMKG